MMADQERKLDHGLQVMLDLLTNYLGNYATRTEWVVEIQKRFTSRRKLRRGWSDDRIDVKIRKLEQMGLITGGRGLGMYYSAITTAQPRTEQSLLGFASGANDTQPAFTRESPVSEGFLDVLNAARLQLLKPSAP
jgi:hypothetical protein